MSKILFFILLFCQCNYCFGTDGIVKVKGVVVDSNGGFLPYVILSADKKFIITDSISMTDANGIFELKLKQSDDSCRITFSYTGYKVQTYNLSPISNIDMGRIVMQEDTIILHEVVVKSNTLSHQQDKTMYFPTVTQRNASNTGGKLLYNMMIPELKVEKSSGFASTIDGKKVTILINGVEASKEEIKGIRPKDVVRVDFYPIPSGKFSQYEAVVDFVVRKFDSGGYANAITSTDFLEPKGSYDISISYHKNRWDYYTAAGYGFTKDSKPSMDIEESVMLSPSFIRHSYIDSGINKTNDAYGMFNAKYQYKNVYLNIGGGIRWNKTPKYITQGTVTYTIDAYAGSNDSLSSNSQSLSPYLNTHFQWTINKRNTFIIKAGYSHADNTFHRHYMETGYSKPIVSNTTEFNNAYNLDASYFLDFNDDSELAVGYKFANIHYDDIYTGTTDAKQCLTSRTNDIWAKFQHTFSQKLYGFVRVSVLNTNTIINRGLTTEWSFRPQVNLTYNFNKTSKLIFKNIIDVLKPSVQERNSTEQSVNEYEIIRGEEHLGDCTEFLPSLAYRKSWDSFIYYVDIIGSFFTHTIQDDYYVKDQKLIHTFKHGGFRSTIGNNAGGTLFLMNRNLQLNAGCCYLIDKTNDDYSRNLNSWFWYTGLLYAIGDISLNAYYQSGGRGAKSSTSIYITEPATYGLSVNYSKGGIYASLGISNLLSKNAMIKNCLNSNVYNKTSIERDRDYRPYITLEVSYNIDFGHRKIQKEKIMVNKEINNAILNIK